MAYSKKRGPRRILSGTFVRDFLGDVSHSLKGGTLSRAFGRNAPHFVGHIDVSPRRIEIAVSRHSLGRNGTTGESNPPQHVRLQVALRRDEGDA